MSACMTNAIAKEPTAPRELHELPKIERIAWLASAIGALSQRILDGRGGQGSAVHECKSLVDALSQELLP